MRPLRYSINVTLDGCCHHEAGMVSDEESMRLIDASLRPERGERDQLRRCKASPTTGSDRGGPAPRSANVGPGPYARHVANASPSPTPNPDAMKFTLDTTLPEKLDVTSPDAAVGVPFAEAVFAAGGVASIFGVNDFVTVRRQPGCDWGPIVAVVVAAAAAHL